MAKRQRLALAVLVLDADVQPRETMSSSLIDEYAKLYREGHELPPITVFRDGIDYWVADGFHRTSGARKAGLTEITAEVEAGSKRDAILYACGSNKHGKARSNDDKRRAVTRILDDPEWGQWRNVRIALHCGVTEGLVRKMRLEREKARQDSYSTTTPEPAVESIADLIEGQPDVAVTLRQELETGEITEDDLTREEIEALFPGRQPPVEAPAVDAPALILTSQAVPDHGKRPTFNDTNEMVDWAKWTWNPVTGCLHDCDYCYARDIANRYYDEKFQPTFRPERLKAPHFTRVPAKAETQIGWRNVFVCSMADLFGKWVPQAWIDAVLAEVRAAPQWNFLFLTKFPQRLAAIDWPDNAWVGTTVDRQYRVKIAEQAFREVKAPVKWLSCEPLLEDLTFSSLVMFDWVVMGGASESTKTPAFQPPWAWVEHLFWQARQADCLVYMKPNLATRCQEYPRGRRR